MKKYNFFEVLLFAVVSILLYIKVFNQTHIVLILVVLFSVIFTIFVIVEKNSITKKTVKLFIVWVMVVCVCFFRIPSLPLGFLTIGISVFGLITRQVD